MTPEEQARQEWAAIQKRRREIGQEDRPWNTPEAGKEWVRERTKGIERERS